MKTALLLTFLAALPLTAVGDDESIAYNRILFDFAILDASGAVSPPARSAAPVFTPGRRGNGINRSDTANSPLLSTDEYEARIADIKESSGPYSTQLREEYESLGRRLQRQGEHEKAITAFETAIHIERVNNGLFTPQQIPLVKHIINSYHALEDFAKADDQHDYLYYIQQKTYAPDSEQALAAKQEWADWNLEYFLSDGITQPMEGEYPNFRGGMNRFGKRIEYVSIQNTTTGLSYYISQQDLARGNSAGIVLMPEDVLDNRLQKARKAYEELINSSLGAGDGRNKLILQQANIALSIKRQMDALDRVGSDGPIYRGKQLGFVTHQDNNVVTRAYSSTRDALKQAANQQEQISSVAGADAWMAVGDWELRFGNPQTGKEAYEKALALLARSGLSGDALAKAFNPAPLIPLPALAVHPYTRAFHGMPAFVPLDYKGHMDIKLLVTDRGQVRSLTIADATPNSTVVLRRMLLDYLRAQPMRPLVQDGKLVKESALTLRVYYAY